MRMFQHEKFVTTITFPFSFLVLGRLNEKKPHYYTIRYSNDTKVKWAKHRAGLLRYGYLSIAQSILGISTTVFLPPFHPHLFSMSYEFV